MIWDKPSNLIYNKPLNSHYAIETFSLITETRVKQTSGGCQSQGEAPPNTHGAAIEHNSEQISARQANHEITDKCNYSHGLHVSYSSKCIGISYL